MKASECLKKPGDVARRDTDGAIAYMYRTVPHYKGGMNSVCMWWPSTQGMGEVFTMREVDAMPGSWTPLLPALDLDKVPKVDASVIVKNDGPWGDGEMYTTVKENVAVLVSDLKKHAITVPDTAVQAERDTCDKIRIAAERQLVRMTEKRDALQSRVEELERELDHLRGTSLGPGMNLIDEVARRRGWLPLKPGETMTVHYDEIEYCIQRSPFAQRPMPTLPAPAAEVPNVPAKEPPASELIKWFDALTRKVGWGSDVFARCDINTARKELIAALSGEEVKHGE